MLGFVPQPNLQYYNTDRLSLIVQFIERYLLALKFISMRVLEKLQLVINKKIPLNPP
jgi:hypothetical protein